MKVKLDNCGCPVQRRYASDFLMTRLYQLRSERGFKKLGRRELEGGRWFELYSNGTELRYRSSECPLLIIALEVLLEASEDGRRTREELLASLKSIKGLQMNELLEKVVENFHEVISVETSGVHH